MALATVPLLLTVGSHVTATCSARRSSVVGAGAGALYHARVYRYDVVVLDRGLPEVSGDDVCRALNAEQPATKVLMLTAAATVDEIVDGLCLGADDYLSKPLRFDELVARIHALARRAGPARGR